jgi:hypothetical protein
MKPKDAAIELMKYLLECGLDGDSWSVERGMPPMLALYRDQRVDGCKFESDADMLLYQWGVYNWGQGEFFQLDITRQLCLDSSSDDEDIWQLGITFKFNPTPPLRALGKGNRWCHDLDELEEFERFIRASEVYKALATAVPAKVDIRYECAG